MVVVGYLSILVNWPYLEGFGLLLESYTRGGGGEVLGFMWDTWHGTYITILASSLSTVYGRKPQYCGSDETVSSCGKSFTGELLIEASISMSKGAGGGGGGLVALVLVLLALILLRMGVMSAKRW